MHVFVNFLVYKFSFFVVILIYVGYSCYCRPCKAIVYEVAFYVRNCKFPFVVAGHKCSRVTRVRYKCTRVHACLGTVNCLSMLKPVCSFAIVVTRICVPHFFIEDTRVIH